MKGVSKRFRLISGMNWKHYIQSSSILTFLSVWGMLCGFFVTWLFANFLEKRTFGTYSYLLAVISFMSIFSMTGMGIAVSRAAAIGLDGVYREALLISLKWSLLGSLVVFFFASNFLFLWHDYQISLILSMIAFIFPLLSPCTLYHSYFRGKEKYGFSAALSVFVVTTKSLLITLVVLMWPGNLLLLFAATFLPQISFNTCLTVILVRLVANKASDTESLKFGKKVQGVVVLETISSLINTLVIPAFLSLEELAAYAISIAIPECLRALLKNIRTVLFPRFARLGFERGKEILQERVWIVWAVPLILILPYVIIAPQIFDFFFPRYREYATLSQLIALSVFFSFFNIITWPLLEANAKGRFLLFIELGTSLTTIFTSILLIQSYGLLGAVASLFIQRITRLGLTALTIWRPPQTILCR